MLALADINVSDIEDFPNGQDTLEVKEKDLQKRKNQIMMMLSEINKLDISQDEIALKDIDSLRQDIDAIGGYFPGAAPDGLKKIPVIPLLDFSKLRGEGGAP